MSALWAKIHSQLLGAFLVPVPLHAHWQCAYVDYCCDGTVEAKGVLLSLVTCVCGRVCVWCLVVCVRCWSCVFVCVSCIEYGAADVQTCLTFVGFCGLGPA